MTVDILLSFRLKIGEKLLRESLHRFFVAVLPVSEC